MECSFSVIFNMHFFSLIQMEKVIALQNEIYKEELMEDRKWAFMGEL
jgi:hypothetical protein